METVFKPQKGKVFLFGILKGYAIWLAAFIISLIAVHGRMNFSLLFLVTFACGMAAGLIWQAATNAGKGIVVSKDKIAYKRFGKEKEILSGNISVSPITNVRYGKKDMPVKIQGLEFNKNGRKTSISCNFLNSEDFKKVCNMLGCKPCNTNKNGTIKNTIEDGLSIDEKKIRKQILQRKIIISEIFIVALIGLLLAFTLPLSRMGVSNSVMAGIVAVWCAIAAVVVIMMFMINKRAEVTSASIPSEIKIHKKEICIDQATISLDDIQNIVMNEPKHNALFNGFRFMKIQCYNERKVYCFGRYKANGIRKEICPEYNILYEELKENLPEKFM